MVTHCSSSGRLKQAWKSIDSLEIRSLTLFLLVLKVHSNVSGTVQPQCAENELCMGTSGCFPLTTRRTSPNPQLTNMRPHRHRHLSHFRGLVSEFQILLSTYIEAVLNVTAAWNNESRHVPVLERGLRKLYPMSNETELYTSAGSGDEHRILRESRWLLTSAEAHVQLLHAVNYTGADVFHSLGTIARHRSTSFTHLLAVFHVTGLPEQATCVRTSVSRTASLISHKAEFTTMALRDIHQALVRVHGVLGSCETSWLDRDLRRAKLQCFEASVFYPTMPQGLRFLYDYSDVLAPDDDSAQ